MARKSLIVSVIMLVTLAVTLIVDRSTPSLFPEDLEAAMKVPGWVVRSHNLDEKVVESLRLDDYIFARYAKNPENTVDLYIGLYNSKDKVGAAHSPLVCFPGQGWVLSDELKSNMVVGAGSGHEINYARFRVKKGEESDLLVIYWYQAGRYTLSDTFRQKLYLFASSFLYGEEPNAFVRVSVSVKDDDVDEAFNKAKSFLGDFYPTFDAYLKSGYSQGTAADG